MNAKIVKNGKADIGEGKNRSEDLFRWIFLSVRNNVVLLRENS